MVLTRGSFEVWPTGGLSKLTLRFLLRCGGEGLMVVYIHCLTKFWY